MRSRKIRGLLSPGSLEDTYAELGDFPVKMMIDPSRSQSITDVKVDVRNSDGTPMRFDYKRWGTKLNITFTIDENTPDGVSVIDVTMKSQSGPIRERFDFWVIK